jgi:hypothetical protein
MRWFPRIVIVLSVVATFSSAQSSDHLLQLQIAEYNTLTTRNTYLLTMQYSLLPVLLLYVPMLLALRHWTENMIIREVLIWGGFAGALVLAHLWAEDLYQQFNNVRYLETELRPQIAQSAGLPHFWCYEPYLSAQRGTAIQWWEWGVPVTAAIVFVIILLYKRAESGQSASESVKKFSVDREQRAVVLPLRWLELTTARVVNYGGIVTGLYLMYQLVVKVYLAVHVRLAMTSGGSCH